MTHTTAGGGIDDVKVKLLPLPVSLPGITKVDAYGWRNMRRLAKTLPYADVFADKACDHNADTFTYFALGKIMDSSR